MHCFSLSFLYTSLYLYIFYTESYLSNQQSIEKSSRFPINCDEFMNNMKPLKVLQEGIVKKIYLVEWNNQKIVMSKLRDIIYLEDFISNRENLIKFHGNSFITELLGFCRDNVIFTRFYSNGNLHNLHRIFSQHKIKNFSQKFKYCFDYVQILNYLHQNGRIMCDSNSLDKTLTQYLIDDNLKIILNDLDALPEMDERNRTRCGKKRPIGDLVPPEQEYSTSYDHKIDIWKIPEICFWFIQNDKPKTSFARSLLYFVHNICKFNDPNKRPQTLDVLELYQLIMLLEN